MHQTVHWKTDLQKCMLVEPIHKETVRHQKAEQTSLRRLRGVSTHLPSEACDIVANLVKTCIFTMMVNFQSKQQITIF